MIDSYQFLMTPACASGGLDEKNVREYLATPAVSAYLSLVTEKTEAANAEIKDSHHRGWGIEFIATFSPPSGEVIEVRHNERAIVCCLEHEVPCEIEDGKLIPAEE